MGPSSVFDAVAFGTADSAGPAHLASALGAMVLGSLREVAAAVEAGAGQGRLARGACARLARFTQALRLRGMSRGEATLYPRVVNRRRIVGVLERQQKI